jgi:hypothetical protein
MLPLDHIPFYDVGPDALADGFARLGGGPAVPPQLGIAAGVLFSL